jgi:hypothetical protein
MQLLNQVDQKRFSSLHFETSLHDTIIELSIITTILSIRKQSKYFNSTNL